MKIELEILGMPNLAGLIGKRTQIEFPGKTVKDLIELLKTKHGRKAGDLLGNSRGELDETIQILLNDSFLPREEVSSRLLAPGDRIKFILLIGGG